MKAIESKASVAYGLPIRWPPHPDDSCYFRTDSTMTNIKKLAGTTYEILVVFGTPVFA